MTPSRKLGSGLYISAEKVVPVLLMMLLSFLKTSGLIFLETGVTVAFLSAAGIGALPALIMTAGVLSAGLFPLLLRSRKKSAFLPPLLIAASAFIVPAILSSAFYSASGTAFAAMTIAALLRPATEAVFIMTAYRFGLFNGYSKPLIAVLATDIFAAFLSAGAVRAFAGTLSPLGMTLTAGVLMAGVPFVITVLMKNGSLSQTDETLLNTPETHGGQAANQHKKAALFFAAAGVLAFSASVFDFSFLFSAIEKTGGDATRLTIVFADLFAAVGIVSFLTVCAAVSRKTTAFPLLFIAPAAMIAAAAGEAKDLFAAILFARAAFMVVARVSKEAIFLVIPKALTVPVGYKAVFWRKVLAEPVGTVAAGIILYRMMEGDATTRSLNILLASSGIIAFVLFHTLRQVYVTTVLHNLRSFLWRGGLLLMTGHRLGLYLKSKLASSDPDEAIYALRVMEEALSPAFAPALIDALKNPSDAVRIFALRRIAALDLRGALPDVIDCAERDFSPEVTQEGWKTACLIGTSKTREEATEKLNDPVAGVGALIGLLSVGREGVFSAIDKTAQLIASNYPSDRMFAAKALGEAGNAAFYNPLLTLLNDEDGDVCREAVIAAGKIKEPRLLPALMDAFRFPDLREDGVTALLAYGETAFPEIERVLFSTDYPVQFRFLLANLLRHIPTDACRAFAFDCLAVPDRRVRFALTKTLVSLGFKAHGKQINQIRLMLYDEIETATMRLAAIEKLEKHPDESVREPLGVLTAALYNEIAYAKERILLLLALLQPSAALSGLVGRYAALSEKERAESSDIVGKILSGELRKLCLPLFEQTGVSEKLTNLRPHFYPPMMTVSGYAHSIAGLEGDGIWDWTRAAALYVLGFVGEKADVDVAVPLLTHQNAIVRETAVWLLGRLLPPDEASRLLTGCVFDPSPAVARMAMFVSDSASLSSV